MYSSRRQALLLLVLTIWAFGMAGTSEAIEMLREDDGLIMGTVIYMYGQGPEQQDVYRIRTNIEVEE